MKNIETQDGEAKLITQLMTNGVTEQEIQIILNNKLAAKQLADELKIVTATLLVMEKEKFDPTGDPESMNTIIGYQLARKKLDEIIRWKMDQENREL